MDMPPAEIIKPPVAEVKQISAEQSQNPLAGKDGKPDMAKMIAATQAASRLESNTQKAQTTLGNNLLGTFGVDKLKMGKLGLGVNNDSAQDAGSVSEQGFGEEQTKTLQSLHVLKGMIQNAQTILGRANLNQLRQQSGLGTSINLNQANILKQGEIGKYAQATRDIDTLIQLASGKNPDLAQINKSVENLMGILGAVSSEAQTKADLPPDLSLGSR